MFCEGKVVADHERVWAKHQTLSDPAHVVAAQALRHERIVLIRPRLELLVQVRNLSEYDTALGRQRHGGLMAAVKARTTRDLSAELEFLASARWRDAHEAHRPVGAEHDRQAALRRCIGGKL